MDFGTGESSSLAELGGFGVEVAEKRDQWRESIEQIANMMVMDPYPGFEGKYFSMPCRNVVPKPVQKPHPPIHVGGGWPHAAKRAIAYGDGWSPIHGFGDLPAKLPEFRTLAQEAGRDTAQLEVSIFGVGPKASTAARYRDAGAQRLIFALPPSPRDEVLPLLDRYRSVADEL